MLLVNAGFSGWQTAVMCFWDTQVAVEWFLCMSGAILGNLKDCFGDEEWNTVCIKAGVVRTAG